MSGMAANRVSLCVLSWTKLPSLLAACFCSLSRVRLGNATQAVFPNLESRLDVRMIGTPVTHQVRKKLPNYILDVSFFLFEHNSKFLPVYRSAKLDGGSRSETLESSPTAVVVSMGILPGLGGTLFFFVVEAGPFRLCFHFVCDLLCFSLICFIRTVIDVFRPGRRENQSCSFVGMSPPTTLRRVTRIKIPLCHRSLLPIVRKNSASPSKLFAGCI